MAWTTDQLKAINTTGSNIIVSAGAGSGKTAVLTTRVLELIKKGIHINELLILTFTNAAAGEMKERIKKNLEKENLTEELAKIDAAYITTFDSFALSLVKKYHYLLNIPQNITITDSTILNKEKRRILREIFNEYYEKNNNLLFQNWINTNCIKDDDELFLNVLNLANKLEIRIDLNNYLKNYLNNFYNSSKIKTLITEYLNILKEKIDELLTALNLESNYFETDYYNKMYEITNDLTNYSSLDELIAKINIFKLPILPRGSDEETKDAKERINKVSKELKDLTVYGNEETIIKDYLESKNHLEIIIEILTKYFQKLTDYKMKNYLFDFNDIAHLSLKILEENKDIRNSLKNEIKEIMVDEYQDTSDIQEKFISLIENKNVYMVGDIKQSIYRFRNANPNIFRQKYNAYSQNQNGLKIDLLKNFRSRKEVLNNINTIFNPIMDEEIGNADYQTSHQMVFGNVSYEENGKTNNNNQMEILTYNANSKEYTKEEIEIFAIGKDILTKIDSNYLVYDMKKDEKRPATYKDFCIIMDRNSSFDLTKKIFEYLGIPLTLYKDEELNNNTDIYLIKNIFILLNEIKENNYQEKFKHAFLSVARSFLYRLSDEEIFTLFKNFQFKNSIVYKDLIPITKKLEITSIEKILNEIIEITDFYNKLITNGDVEEATTRLETIINLTKNYSSLGHNIEDFISFLDELLIKDEKIKYNLGTSSSNSVKIMNIHKSKGLEFPICYFNGLYKSFSKADLKGLIIYEKDSPIYVPIFRDGIKENIIKLLIKEKIKKEDISEKIRLFYVALTRAKEKMIFLIPEKENLQEIKDENAHIIKSIRYKYSSLADLFYSIPNELKHYEKKLDINTINLTKDYLKSKDLIINIKKDNTRLTVNEIDIKIKNIENKTFSKKNIVVIDKETKRNMDLGIKVHETLELIDFKNYNSNIIDDLWLKSLIEKLIKSFLFKNIENAEIYQEYEFIYEKDSTIYHGIIDLMLVYDDHIDIIDYKLNDITDESYIKQLKGYKEYIKSQKNVSVYTYLFSILTGTIKEIN